MILWLIEFALVIMFKVYGNFGISKIEFFKFSNNENLSKIKKVKSLFKYL